MNSPLSSNLVHLINKAIDNCFYDRVGKVDVDDGDNGLVVSAEWVDSKNKEYLVMRITISENGMLKFSYDDYGTECK